MHWRIRFLFNFAQVFCVPPAITSSILSFASLDLPILPRILAYISSVAIYINVVSWYGQWTVNRKARSLGARPVPIAKGKWPGNLDLLLRVMQTPRKAYVGARIQELLLENKAQFLNIRPLWNDMIFTDNEGIIKHVLATNFGVWGKGWVQRERMQDFFGQGIFNVDGKVWKQHRAMTRPYFIKERISDFEIFWKHSVVSFDVLNSIAKSPVPVVDVQDFLARFTLDAASEFLFGKCLDTIHGQMPIPGEARLGPKGSLTEDEFGSFVSAFEAAQIQTSMRAMRSSMWPLAELFENKVKTNIKIIHNFLDPLIAEAKAEILKKKQVGLEGEGPETLLQELVKTVDDPNIVRNELLSVLLAGRDTTATLLAFTLYLLSQHPEVEQKLRAEISEHCEGAPPTYATIKKMKYLRAVLDETLRLFPPVPLNQRACEEDTTLPAPKNDPDQRPFFIPAHTAIIYSTVLMQRKESLWGPTAESFDPDRWSNPKMVAEYHQNFQFVPFNAGPRICPGQNFAYNEASFFLCVLLPRFKFTLAPEYQPAGSTPLPEWKENGIGRVKYEKIWPLSSMTLYCKGGLWMRVEPLSEV